MSHSLSILLVEDDPAHIALIQRGIMNYSEALRLTAVASLSEARRYLKHLTPNIAIVDLQLPDGKGIELLEENYPFPIIILTGHNSEEAETLSIQAGAVAYVVKDEAIFRNLPQIVLNAQQTRSEKALCYGSVNW